MMQNIYICDTTRNDLLRRSPPTLTELTEIGRVEGGHVDGAEVHLAGEDVAGGRHRGRRGRGTFAADDIAVVHVGYDDGAGRVGVAVAGILAALVETVAPQRRDGLDPA